MTDGKAVNVPRLIAVPSLITLVITILRVVGELKHWPSPLVSNAAGGGAAILGIAWLPIIFGPYFAMKLAGMGDVPSSYGKAIGYSIAGLVVLVLGGAIFFYAFTHGSKLGVVGAIIMLIAAFVPAMGWRSLGRTLLGYALAARIPVLVVMYFAMTANNGAGWGTHYDAVGPQLANLPVTTKYIMAGVIPQLTIWIAWTTILGSLLGGIAGAVSKKDKPATSAAA